MIADNEMPTTIHANVRETKSGDSASSESSPTYHPTLHQRTAILPPTTTSSRTSSPMARVSSPSPSAPPVVPRRNRIMPVVTPPSLPPKPDSLPTRPISCNVENESTNNRRSVADMARMFSSAETPFRNS